MINNISFINDNWLWQIVIVTLSIWLVFIWKEKLKLKKRNFYFNNVVSFIALASLALIALKPNIKTSIKPWKAVLLTDDFSKIQLDSLKRVHKKLSIYNYEASQPLFPDSETPETTFILGNGLKQFDFWQLDSIRAKYIGGSKPKGVVKFKYDIENSIGNEAKFIGQYLNPINGDKLFIEGPAGKELDSVILINSKQQEFQLSASMKVKGEFMYQLVEKDSSNNIIKKDPIPIIIKEKKLLRIFIVNASPSFETKYLKNYLAESGHKVLAQSRLTKDRYKYEYFNMSNKSNVGFTQEQLKPYDLLIIDGQSLNLLSSYAKNAIENSVKEDGLGVFIQPEKSFYNLQNRWYSFKFLPNNKSVTQLEISPKINITKSSFVFKDDISIEPIASNNLYSLSAYKRLGIGRVGSSVLQNTFELQLNGNASIYKQLWAKIIEEVSKKDISTVEWSSNSQIVNKDEPFNFTLRTAQIDPLVTSQGYRIPLKMDVNINSLWHGILYPKNEGWNTLETSQDTTSVFKYFVTKSANWQSLKAARTIQVNKEHFNINNTSKIRASTNITAINPLWLFIIFVICMGYLWLDSRMFTTLG